MKEILAVEFLLIYCRPPDTISKLDCYGICGVSNDWFKSCMCNRSQFVLINGCDSGLAAITCGVPPRFCSRAPSILAKCKRP